MKKISFLFAFLLLVSIQKINAQCSSCTPVFNTCPPAGGICNRLDTAYANHPYDKVLNFFMPKQINDPAILAQCSCNQVNLLTITVTGVNGLPAGITYTMSQNGQYNVVGGDSLGCAHFCGTPLLAGTYYVTVNLLANVTAIGTPIGNVTQNNNPQSYRDTLYVLPDTVVGVSSFTYGNNGSSACDSISVDLHANKTAQLPNMTRWFWDINGNKVEGKDQGVYKFTNTGTQPDTFDVILHTVFYQYVIKSISIYGINSGWYSDWNEASALNDPEPYMVVGSLGTTNTCANAAPSTKTPSWNNLNYVVPVGTSSITMDLWDDDLCGNSSTTIALFGLADDKLETLTTTVGLGLQVLAGNGNNANGNVRFDTIPGVVLKDTLHVIVNPSPIVPVITAQQDTFCSSDSLLITIGGGYPGYNFEWYRDDTVYLADVNSASFYTTFGGEFKVKVINQLTGCSNQSARKKFTKLQGPPSSINVLFNGTSAFVTPFPATGYSVDWYYNGNLVVGQHGKFLAYLGNGVYSAEVYNTIFPSCRTVANPKDVCIAPAAPTASAVSVCHGAPATLSASGSGTLGWYSAATVGTYLGGGSTFTTNALIANATFYVQDSTCGASATRTAVAVTVVPLPVATANLLTGTVSVNQAGASYQWLDCNNNNAPINGANGQTYSPTAIGSYAVIVTLPGCTDTSACVNLSTLGIDEIVNGNQLNVYPNPNNGKFMLKFSTETMQHISIRVENMIGQVAVNRQLENFTGTFSEELDLQELGKGIYFVSVETAKGRLNTKVVVQ